jgi:hypothetical protein
MTVHAAICREITVVCLGSGKTRGKQEQKERQEIESATDTAR